MDSNTTKVNAAQLAEFLHNSSVYLGDHKAEIDALNVFPVPDGDTGINMSLTVSSADKKISANSIAAGVGKVAGDFAMGALMGARGNSGVILSQIFRGFSTALSGKSECTTKELAAAMHKGVELSYKSVMKPVEGTILTVYKAFSNAAMAAADKGASIIDMLQDAMKAGEKALANTPNQLPVLKEAGVVDAGGAGLLCFIRGGIAAIGNGEDPGWQIELSTRSADAPAIITQEETPAISTENIEFTFCTQMLIKGENLPIDTIRDHLSQDPPGDSLLVVGDENVIKIHFHNNQPWKVLEYCSQFGSLHDIIVDNMVDQHHENKAAQELAEQTTTASETTAPAEDAPEDAPLCGVIAVCSGDGMGNLFSEFGATIISGGQTMNPSAEDILNAVESNPASEIVILPNNSNIILAADQVKNLTSKPVQVIRSKFITQGLSAMLAFDADKSAEANAEAMSRTLDEIVNGELTYSIRPAKFNGFDIEKGDILALLNGEIIGCGKEIDAMLFELAQKMVDSYDEGEIITLYHGEDISEEQAEELKETLAEKFPDYEVELYYGGQPLYYFLLSVE